ncbi:hypothetical protein BGX33_001118 [Mortierella sp. NVP41]|nr:hypothetical protein BGX33_001118 [Mortierella sp. NVP41]
MDIPSPHSFIFSDEYICHWDSCLKNFDDAETLYQHLRDDHVGRKAHHNLCLTCHWDKCTVPTFLKRDHITSHLRVHVASKPHTCETCKKSFKRPQDLRKHEKTHDNHGIRTPAAADTKPDAKAASASSSSSSAHLQPIKDPDLPLTPPTPSGRSPSVVSTLTGSSISPYPMPLSPADTLESWNPGLSSPSYSTSSDLFSSPAATDLELEIMNAPFGQPSIDVSDIFYGAFPSASSYDDITSPSTTKRPRDSFDEVLTDTLGAFALEAKKKRFDPSYNEDMRGRLDALSAILEENPLTPDRLLTSLPEVSDWNQFNQFNQYCSTLFEDLSGEAFEPQSYDIPLFPEYDQKQTPIALEGQYNAGLNGFPAYDANGAFTTAHTDSTYRSALPNGLFDPASTMNLSYGTSELPWEVTPSLVTPGVMRKVPQKQTLQQPNRFTNPQYVSLPALQQGSDFVKIEPKEEVIEPTVVKVKVERTYNDMATQTQGKQARAAFDGSTMLMMLPARLSPLEKKKKTKDAKPLDPAEAEALLGTAPEAPTSPLPEIEVTQDVSQSIDVASVGREQEQEVKEEEQEQEGGRQDSPTTPTEQAEGKELEQNDSTEATSGLQQFGSRFGSYVQKARARQAAAAAAAAAANAVNAATTATTATLAAPTPAPEVLSPVDAMTRQLAQVRLDGSDPKPARKPSTTRPITAGDIERQLRAAKARSLCAEDPVRRQHAEVVLGLLKSIDALMVEHRQKVAQYKATVAAQATMTGSSAGYPRPSGSGVHVHQQGAIRTVSSLLPRRGAPSTAGSSPRQPSPFHYKQGSDSKPTRPDYSQYRVLLKDGASPPSESQQPQQQQQQKQEQQPALLSADSEDEDDSEEEEEEDEDSPVLYPTSDLHHPSIVPFELSDAERRFIEEDNAKTAKAAAARTRMAHV